MDPFSIVASTPVLAQLAVAIVELTNKIWDAGANIIKAPSEKREKIAKYIGDLAKTIGRLEESLRLNDKVAFSKVAAELDEHAKVGGLLLAEAISMRNASSLFSSMASHVRTLSVSPELLGLDWAEHREAALHGLLQIGAKLKALATVLTVEWPDKESFSQWQQVQSTQIAAYKPGEIPSDDDILSQLWKYLSYLFPWNWFG